MSIEVRSLVEDELGEAESIFAHAFGFARRHDPGDDHLETVKKRFEPEWYLGSFDDGEMTSMMRIIPNEMYINGAAIGFGTVSPVASSPLHRRKGHTGQLLRRSIEVMRERGQALSGLYTPHPAFYRRYGWEIASEQRRYTFKPKDLSLQAQPSQRGRFRALRPESWRELEPVYAEYARDRNGPFVRPGRWWDSYVVGTNWDGVHDIVLWHDDAGRAQGYGIYLLPTSGSNEGKVIVNELVALTSDARLNLLSFFGRYDLHSEVVITAPSSDPLPLLFADTERLTITQGYAVLLRVCDFEAAMSARPPAQPDDAAEIVVALQDRIAPWNDGTWRVAVVEGRTLVERTGAEPEMTISELGLPPIFNGYVKPSLAFEAGLIEAASTDALERADRVFAVKHAPFFPDHF